jgi:hypothetical protein
MLSRHLADLVQSGLSEGTIARPSFYSADESEIKRIPSRPTDANAGRIMAACLGRSGAAPLSRGNTGLPACARQMGAP